MKQFGLKEAFISFFTTVKLSCITKEAMEEKFNIKEGENEDQDVTIGDDLESFIQRITSGQITKQSLSDFGEKKQTCQLNLLTAEESKKLQLKDQNYLDSFHSANPDVPESIMKKSEYKTKFAETEFWRETFFIEMEQDSSDDSS